MKLLLLISASIILLLLPDRIHASVPDNVDTDPVTSATIPVQNLAPVKSRVTGNNFIQKASYKMLVKKYRKHAKRHGASMNDTGRNAEILSTLSLIAGVTGFIAFVTPSFFFLGFVLGLIALTSGILALSKYHKTKGAKRKGIIGVVLGSAISVVGLLALLLIAMMGGFY